jgi:hypothetical protein
MNNTETRPTNRRCVYFLPEFAERIDELIKRGAMVSSIVNAALRESLPGIEKRFKTGKAGGVRVRKSAR